MPCSICIYSSYGTGTVPEGTVVFIHAKFALNPAGIVDFDVMSCIIAPGDPQEEDYIDRQLPWHEPTVFTTGTVISHVANTGDGGRGIIMQVSQYCRDSAKSFQVWYVS